MNIREFMIILGLKWLTRTDTIWHLVLALFSSLFLPSFFLVRLRWDATFGLLNLAPRLLATALLPKLVPGPRRVPGQRHWSLFHVHFSPPARWGLLDFMSVACSSPPLLSSSSCSTATLDAQCSLSDLNHDHPRPVFPVGPQPRPSPPSVPCRTSTTTIHAQCSLPDLNREYPRQVFPAGPHVGRYGTKNVQKKVRKNARRYAR